MKSLMLFVLAGALEVQSPWQEVGEMTGLPSVVHWLRYTVKDAIGFAVRVACAVACSKPARAIPPRVHSSSSQLLHSR
jgi:hypothetical protein